MFRKIGKALKEETNLKDACLWFVASFLIVFLVFIFVMNKSVNSALFIETFGFAFVFVILMIGTKTYSNFVEKYNKSFEKYKYK